MSRGVSAQVLERFRTSEISWVWEKALERIPQARLKWGNDCALYVHINPEDTSRAKIWSRPRTFILEQLKAKAPECVNAAGLLTEKPPLTEVPIVIVDGGDVYVFFAETKEMLS